MILPLPGAGGTGSQYTSTSEDDTLLAHTLDGASEGSENTQPEIPLIHDLVCNTIGPSMTKHLEHLEGLN